MACRQTPNAKRLLFGETELSAPALAAARVRAQTRGQRAFALDESSERRRRSRSSTQRDRQCPRQQDLPQPRSPPTRFGLMTISEDVASPIERFFRLPPSARYSISRSSSMSSSMGWMTGGGAGSPTRGLCALGAGGYSSTGICTCRQRSLVMFLELRFAGTVFCYARLRRAGQKPVPPGSAGPS